jgi:hypothetical protein
LKSNDSNSRILLLKSSENLTIENVVDKLINIQKGDCLTPVDTFKMPVVSFNLSRSYDELIGIQL